MSETISSIYAPSLYWFAYGYHEGLVISANNNNSSSGNESPDSRNEPVTDEPVGAKHSGNESSDAHNKSSSRMLRPDSGNESSDAHNKSSSRMLRPGTQVNLPINPQWVKDEYDKILTAFDISLEFNIREDKPSRHFDLLEKSDGKTGRIYKYITTKGEENNKKLEGFIYPQCVHDSYALNLNIFCPENRGTDEYAVADLGKFNPEKCFNPPVKTATGYIGQTLFLSAYLQHSPPENVHDLADSARQCWLSFFQIDPEKNHEKFPPLYRAGKWFGGYFYEYGDPRDDLTENPYGHLLIWFLFDESPTLLLQKCYWELPELLLYYHKVSKSFQDSRIFYEKADNIVRDNETELNEFKQKYLSQENGTNLGDNELQYLKNTLKKLLRTSLSYSQELRNLEYAQNTIAINTKNYQAIREYMAELAATPVEVFQIFEEKDAIAFQAQISANLNYFKPGYVLLDTAISSIRGLVEIDQAERDRILQNQNQQLQDQIQAIGVGIAAGAIVASSSGLMLAEQITLPWEQNHGKDLHPFTIAVLLSSACAIIFWWLVFCGLKLRRNPANNNK